MAADRRIFSPQNMRKTDNIISLFRSDIFDLLHQATHEYAVLPSSQFLNHREVIYGRT